MPQPFEVVEDKLREAEFFLDRLRASDRFSIDSRYYFSAFVSATRTVTLALQTTMHGVSDFDHWYQGAQAKLKADALAPFFVEIRNDLVHKGVNPLNRVTVEHLREDLFNQMRRHIRSHVFVMPVSGAARSTVLADALQASTLYFISLVNVVFECYDRFKCVVDPRWYFTCDNFLSMGKTLEDAVAELGLSSEWTSCAPAGDGAWRAIRLHQPACQVNDIFRKFLGREIRVPDGDPS